MFRGLVSPNFSHLSQELMFCTENRVFMIKLLFAEGRIRPSVKVNLISEIDRLGPTERVGGLLIIFGRNVRLVHLDPIRLQLLHRRPQRGSHAAELST